MNSIILVRIVFEGLIRNNYYDVKGKHKFLILFWGLFKKQYRKIINLLEALQPKKWAMPHTSKTPKNIWNEES